WLPWRRWVPDPDKSFVLGSRNRRQRVQRGVTGPIIDRAANGEWPRGWRQCELGPVLQPERSQQRAEPENTHHGNAAKTLNVRPAGPGCCIGEPFEGGPFWRRKRRGPAGERTNRQPPRVCISRWGSARSESMR